MVKNSMASTAIPAPCILNCSLIASINTKTLASPFLDCAGFGWRGAGLAAKEGPSSNVALIFPQVVLSIAYAVSAAINTRASTPKKTDERFIVYLLIPEPTCDG